MEKKNGYNVSKQWFDFLIETNEMVSPLHTALYFWIAELNNINGWKEAIGLPTDRTMLVMHIKSYRSYKKALDDLIRWGFIKLIVKSHNQWTCNQIALVLKTKANTKAIPSAQVFETKAGQAYINNTTSLKRVDVINFDNPLNENSR